MVNTSTDTAYTSMHNNNVPSLGLEQQHENLCSNTRGFIRQPFNQTIYQNIYIAAVVTAVAAAAAALTRFVLVVIHDNYFKQRTASTYRMLCRWLPAQ